MPAISKMKVLPQFAYLAGASPIHAIRASEWHGTRIAAGPLCSVRRNTAIGDREVNCNMILLLIRRHNKHVETLTR